MFEGLAGHISFQAPHDFGGIQPFLPSPCHFVAGLVMAGDGGEDDPVGCAGSTVTTPVEPVSGHFP